MIQVIDHDSGVQLGPNEVGENLRPIDFHMMTEYLNKPEVSLSRYRHPKNSFSHFCQI
jgi:hypothetical protein